MTIIQQADQYYKNNKYNRSFFDDLAAYLACPDAAIIKTDDFLLLGHPVRIEDPKSELEDWWNLTDKHDSPNAWFVLLCIGPMKNCLKHMPYWLPWICFHRGGTKWKAYPTSRLKGLLNG